MSIITIKEDLNNVEKQKNIGFKFNRDLILNSISIELKIQPLLILNTIAIDFQIQFNTFP